MMTAKRAHDCATCNVRIPGGKPIEWLDGLGPVHPACAWLFVHGERLPHDVAEVTNATGVVPELFLYGDDA